MAIAEPTVEDVEHAIAELLRDQEIGALATLSPTGAPSVATMHFASDALTVYLHLFTDTRTFRAIQRDPRVCYTLTYLPPDGFDGRRQLRALQVDGTATLVASEPEIAHAIQLSRQQFDWLRESTMFNNFRSLVAADHQAFIRIDPVAAIWTDNRVRMLWRRVVRFTPDGKHIAALTPYGIPTVTP